MSDPAIPRSLRMMAELGVHTVKFVYAQGATSFVTFHRRPVLGPQSLIWNESAKLQGVDKDSHRRDLF